MQVPRIRHDSLRITDAYDRRSHGLGALRRSAILLLLFTLYHTAPGPEPYNLHLDRRISIRHIAFDRLWKICHAVSKDVVFPELPW